MKRLLSLFLSVLVAVSLASCTKKISSESHSDTSTASTNTGSTAKQPLVTGIDPVAYPNPKSVYAYDTLTENQRTAYDALSELVSKVVADKGQKNMSQPLPKAISIQDMNMARAIHTSNFAPLSTIVHSFIFDSSRNDNAMVDALYFDKNDRFPDSFPSELKRYHDTLEAADEILGSLEHDGTDYGKAFAIAKWLTDHVTYDDNWQEKNNLWIFSADGALINKEAVCSGFAKGFDLLCKKAGLHTFTVGDYIDHIWNMICIEAKWYYVDTTWMKSDFYSNFMMSEEICLANGHMKTVYYKDGAFPERTISCPRADSNDLYKDYYGTFEKVISYFQQIELEENKSYPVVVSTPEELKKLRAYKGSYVVDLKNRQYLFNVIKISDTACLVFFYNANA